MPAKKWYVVPFFSKSISIPNICCCCSRAAQKRKKIGESHETFGFLVDIPICKRCFRHEQAYYSVTVIFWILWTIILAFPTAIALVLYRDDPEKNLRYLWVAPVCLAAVLLYLLVKKGFEKLYLSRGHGALYKPVQLVVFPVPQIGIAGELRCRNRKFAETMAKLNSSAVKKIQS